MKSKKLLLAIIAVLVAFIGFFVIALLMNKIMIRDIWMGDYKCNLYITLKKRYADVREYRGTAEEVHMPEKFGPFEVIDIYTDSYFENAYVKRFYIPKKKYKCEFDLWIKGCSNLEEIICEEGLEEFNHWFSYNKNLKKVQLPNSIESIREDAFEGCTSLENITIPNNGKRIVIGIDAFKKTGFEQKHINDKYYVAGDNILIFDNAQTEEEIVIPQGVKYDCARQEIECADIFCSDSLLAAEYMIGADATVYAGTEEFQDIKIEGAGTVVAPENSPIAKYCKENGINFRPITEEEDAIRRQKTEAAAADVVYQED